MFCLEIFSSDITVLGTERGKKGPGDRGQGLRTFRMEHSNRPSGQACDSPLVISSYLSWVGRLSVFSSLENEPSVFVGWGRGSCPAVLSREGNLRIKVLLT